LQPIKFPVDYLETFSETFSRFFYVVTVYCFLYKQYTGYVQTTFNAACDDEL